MLLCVLLSDERVPEGEQEEDGLQYRFSVYERQE